MSEVGNRNASKEERRIFWLSSDRRTSPMMEASVGQPRASISCSSVSVAPSSATRSRTEISYGESSSRISQTMVSGSPTVDSFVSCGWEF